MSRAWRRQADWLLTAFMVLDALILIYTRTVGASKNADQPVARQLIWLALDGLLAWRVWRRGPIAWAVLLLLTGLPLILTLVGAVWPFGPYLPALLAVMITQTALLLSPAVRHHVRERTS